jgi:hypothetical protein
MMNLMRYGRRYRPARSLSLPSRLLQDQELEGLLNPVVTNDNEPELVTDWLPAVDIRDGVLTVSIPKQAKLQARKIDVKSI